MTDNSLLRGGGCVLLTAMLLWLGLPGGGGFWPALFVALVPLFQLCSIERGRNRFLLGFLCGFLHFLLQLYWIVIVLGRYGGLPWYFSFPACIGLAMYMASYWGCFIALAGAVRKRWDGAFFLWFLPLLWVGLDWLRSFLFSGFPWMDLGYGLWQVPQLLQTADIGGHYLLTFFVILVNGYISQLLYFSGRERLIQGGILLLLCVVGLGYSHLRSVQLEEQLSTSETVAVGVVQGNIDQGEKWSPDRQRQTLDIYLQQTDGLLRQGVQPQLTVWPETALPFYPARSPLFSDLIHFVRENDTTILTGSPWFIIKDEMKAEIDFYNSSFLLDSSGAVGDMYFKSHLVPWGEYVPLKKFLPFIAPLVEAAGDFTPGTVVQPLRVGSIRSGVLICFESIFPDIARKWVTAGANILINLTNDAWYGRSSAPYQSMSMSVLRAVETRRSLVRSANTGISGFVDPLGRVKQSSTLFVDWAATEEVELVETFSLYVRFGFLLAPLCLVLSGILFLVAHRRTSVD